MKRRDNTTTNNQKGYPPKMSFQYKLGRMKSRQWTVYPKSQSELCNSNQIVVQSDGAIALLDPNTRKGRLNTKGGYFVHLNYSLGAKDVEFPEEFVRLCVENQPKQGDTLNGILTLG